MLLVETIMIGIAPRPAIVFRMYHKNKINNTRGSNSCSANRNASFLEGVVA
jgi:hypothetical protein